MSQKNIIKNRKCAHCDMYIKADAKGIKEHAEKCPLRKKR